VASSLTPGGIAPISAELPAGDERVRVGLRIRIPRSARWWLARVMWVAWLLAGMTLALVGFALQARAPEVELVHRTDTLAVVVEEASQNAADKLLLVRLAVAAFGWQLCSIGMILDAYVVGLAIPLARRFYRGQGTWGAHAAWTVSGFVWLALYAILASLLGVTGDPRIAVARLLGPTIIALVCFAHGTRVAGAWFTSPRDGRRLAGLLGCGFLILALTDLATFRATNEEIRRVGAAFGSTAVRLGLDRAHLGHDYWLLSPSGDPILSPFLAIAPWLMAGYAFVLTVVTPDDLPALWRRFLAFLPSPRRSIGWYDNQRALLYALTPALVGLWLITSGVISGPIAGTSTPRVVSDIHQIANVSPVYLLLAVPMAGRAWELRANSRDGRTLETQGRNRLLSEARFTRWLFLVAAGLMAGDVSLWAFDQHWPGADWVLATIATIPRAAPAPDLWGYGAVAFFAVGLHYLFLIELPYWCGQRRWKAAERARTELGLASAERALRARLADLTPVPDVRAADSEVTARQLAEYLLAQTDKRAAEEIPVHTVHSLPEAAAKLGRWALLSLLSAGLGVHQAEGSKDAGSLLVDLVKQVMGG
jgi:hypothetical protein